VRWKHPLVPDLPAPDLRRVVAVLRRRRRSLKRLLRRATNRLRSQTLRPVQRAAARRAKTDRSLKTQNRRRASGATHAAVAAAAVDGNPATEKEAMRIATLVVGTAIQKAKADSRRTRTMEKDPKARGVVAVAEDVPAPSAERVRTKSPVLPRQRKASREASPRRARAC
jgi:hypothetical protein